MSVIRFSEQEILEIEGMLKFQIKSNTSIKSIITHSDIYNRKYFEERQLGKTIDEDKLIDDVVGRLFGIYG